MKQAEVNEQKWTVNIDGQEYKIGELIHNQSPSEYLWELIKGYEIKTDFEKYPGRLFFVQDNNILMEYDIENGILFVSYGLIWSKIQSKFNYLKMEMSDLIKSEVEKYLNLRVCTTARCCNYGRSRWRNISI